MLSRRKLKKHRDRLLKLLKSENVIISGGRKDE